MTRPRFRALCAASIAGACVAATAFAANPESGTVSAESPQVKWLGQNTEGSYAASRAMIFADAAGDPGAAPCEQGCDSFKLTVKTQKDLTIGADSPSEDVEPDQVVIRVQKPDGSYLTTVGDSNKGKPLTVKFKNAATGDYVIDYSNNYADAHEYDGFAQLGSGAPAGSGASPNTPPPPSTMPVPGGQQQGNPPTPATAGGGPGQNIDIKVKVGKLSARKLKKARRLTATITVSREVATLTAQLKKGKKVLGSGKRGKTSGTVKVKLKLSKKSARKLRKGTLALAVRAADGNGTSAVKAIKVKLRR